MWTRAVSDSASARKLVVHVVDGDAAVRRGLTRLLSAAGLDGRGYGSAEEFLASGGAGPDACVLLDITAPRSGGAQLREALVGRRPAAPVIAVSADDDAAARACAHALGARLFFRKPVDDQALLDAIAWVTGPDGRFYNASSPPHANRQEMP